MVIAPAVSGSANEAVRTNAQPEGMLSETARKSMKINLTINGRAVTATLVDSAATRDFLSLLPMTLTFEDYARVEKISYLPRKLSTADAPRGTDPSVGDITYYAPWGNLAIFYGDAPYARGLVPLGRLDSGIDAIRAPGKLQVTIEHVESR